MCHNTIPGQCRELDDARLLAANLFNRGTLYRSNPALLHYGLHAFDSPVRAVYEAGIPFAEVR